MYTTAIERLTPLDRTPCIKMYKNNAQSRLFWKIAKRSIKIHLVAFLIRSNLNRIEKIQETGGQCSGARGLPEIASLRLVIAIEILKYKFIGQYTVSLRLWKELIDNRKKK